MKLSNLLEYHTQNYKDTLLHQLGRYQPPLKGPLYSIYIYIHIYLHTVFIVYILNIIYSIYIILLYTYYRSLLKQLCHCNKRFISMIPILVLIS